MIDVDLDIAWCFNTLHFEDLRVFKANLNILHVVDQITDNISDQTRKADIVFSVSEEILDNFSSVNIPAYLIGHGLSDTFLRESIARENQGYEPGTILKFGYVGNMLIKGLDRKAFKEIISENEDVIAA